MKAVKIKVKSFNTARATNLKGVERNPNSPVFHEAKDLLGRQQLIVLVKLWRKEVKGDGEDSLLLASFTVHSKRLYHVHFVQHL